MVILQNAQRLFFEKGLFNTTMEDIAVESNLGRRTLYRYFDTKEDIAYEVVILLLKDWNYSSLKIFENLKGDGLQQLSDFLTKLIDVLSLKKPFMKFIGEFDFYFQDNANMQTKEFYSKNYEDVSISWDSMLIKLIEKGVSDGSIKQDIDAKLTEATISNMLWSFGQRVALRGDNIKKETGIDGVDLIRNQVEIYITALKK